MIPEKKITIYDLADRLGISVGTVYRALHNKGRIAEQTRKRVLDLVEETGFQYNASARALRSGPVHICVIVFSKVPQYLNEIRRGMELAFERLTESMVIPHLYFSHEDINLCTDQVEVMLQECLDKHYHGIILSLPTECKCPFVESIQRLQAAGIAVATVTTDIPEIDSVLAVSSNGHCTGRLAAELMHLTCPGKSIAIMTAHHSIDIHRTYLEGFMSYMDPMPFSSIQVLEHLDNPQILTEQLSKLILPESKIDGIYITSANSVAVLDYVRNHQFPSHIRMLTTDLLQETQELLSRRVAFATIFQQPYKQGYSVVNRLYHYIRDGSDGGVELITPQAVFWSNMEFQNGLEP